MPKSKSRKKNKTNTKIDLIIASLVIFAVIMILILLGVIRVSMFVGG